MYVLIVRQCVDKMEQSEPVLLHAVSTIFLEANQNSRCFVTGFLQFERRRK